MISPTFIIVNEYNSSDCNLKINHFDLYRIKDIREFKEIGIENYLTDKSICIFEWAELAEKYIHTAMLKVYFDYGKNENERLISWE